MILGVGIELLDVGPVDATLAERGVALTQVFSAQELSYAAGKRRQDEHLAARWAAKLAFLKASGLDQDAVGDLSAIEVVRHPSGKPELRLGEHVRALMDGRGPTRMHLTLSHSGSLAVAMVVIELEAPSP